MLETNPFDEDLDDVDPYSTALNSDDEAAQLQMVSQEDDQDGNEDGCFPKEHHLCHQV